MSAVSNQEPPFLSLPDELIAEIFKLCNLSDHFNLALTCHRLANGGAAILARHKTAYREYGTVTDWLPLTIPTVLQKAIEDPYVAWNIRVIEIYGTRYGWEYWGSFRSEPPPTVNVFASPPLEDVESETFQGGETYHDFRWRQVFEKPPNTELWHEEQVDDDLTEDCMTYAMWATKRRDEYQESIIQRYLPNYVDLLVRIMLLPGLNAVYFGNMNLKGDWVLAGDESRPPPLSDLSGCSSVQHIYIDQFIDEWDEVDQDYTAESVIEFLLIPKKLKSLTVRGGLKRQLSNDIGNQGLYATMLHLSKSLDNAIEYNCRLRPAEELWGCFGRNNAVRRLYHGNVKVTINAIELLTPVFPWLRAEKLGLQWEHAKTRQNWRTPQFPPNAEVILIQKSYRDDEVMDEQVMEYLENTLWFLVENNARSGGRLKAIYIQQQPNPNKENRIADYEFSKLIKLGREREIDIY
ncbi:hypothetical protein ACLX1H_005524 [Fusarium chlamydosporum]